MKYVIDSMGSKHSLTFVATSSIGLLRCRWLDGSYSSTTLSHHIRPGHTQSFEIVVVGGGNFHREACIVDGQRLRNSGIKKMQS